MLESLFNKVAGFQGCNFIKKRLQHGCFLVYIAKFSRTAIMKFICEQLLLHLTTFSEQLVFREAIFQNSLSNIFVSNFCFTCLSLNTFISLNNFITCTTFTKKNPSEFLLAQRLKSNEQRAKSNEQRAKSNEQRPKRNEQQAKSNEQRAESNEQRAKSDEQQAKSNEQRAKSNEQQAKSNE